jgi:two-component system response regulator YesN
MARFLVGDDPLLVVEAARSMLEVDRVTRDDIVTAQTGEEAKRLFDEHELDTVLLDVDLPDMDGHDLARDLRVRDPDVPLVAVTGLASHDQRVRRLMENPSVELVRKPLTHEDLAEAGVVPEPPSA